MSTDLRHALHDLAEGQGFRPDSDTWDRGRRVRRRSRVVAGAAALGVVVVVAGVGVLGAGPTSEVTPSGEVSEGAIPSRIVEPPVTFDPSFEDDLAIGRASVAFYSAGGIPTLIGATDGRYRYVKLPGIEDRTAALALSPDGRRLAWSSEEHGVSVADLTTGDVINLHQQVGTGDVVVTLEWRADSAHLTWANRSRGGIVNVVTGDAERASMTDPFISGSVSPGGELAAVIGRRGPAALFVTATSEKLRRTLPPDLYPNGATVVPLGWTDDHLLLASVFSSKGNYVDGAHLVLFTSPDRPKSEWTFRIVSRDIPRNAVLSLAVDLVPDLDGTSSQQFTHDFDGTSSQQFTHDFGEPAWPGERDISWMIGLGVAAAIAVLLGMRRLWRWFQDRRL